MGTTSNVVCTQSTTRRRRLPCVPRMKDWMIHDFASFGAAVLAPLVAAGSVDYVGWIRGILAAFIGGGAGAIAGGVASLMVVPDRVNFAHPGMLLKIMGGSFLLNGVFHLAAYLSKQPIPDIITRTTTTTTTTKTEQRTGQVQQGEVVPCELPPSSDKDSAGNAVV